MSQERKEVLITNEYSYFNCYHRYKPDEILEIINEMKKDGVSSFEIVESYGSVVILYYRLETEEEAFARVNKEVIEREKHRKFREEALLREAQNFGYKLVKE